MTRTSGGLSLLLLALTVGACEKQVTGVSCVETPVSPTGTSGDTVSTNTGLRYVEGLTGSGGQAPWCTSMVVHYTGYLLNGTKFDSSHDPGRTPVVFTPGVGAVIDGFEQGIVGMHVCGSRRLIIPPELGYGGVARRNEAGEIVIPANSTLVFDVELLEVSGLPAVAC